MVLPAVGPARSCPPQLPPPLFQPVGHAHLAVHRRRGGEVFLHLLPLAGAPAEFAEAEVAVGDERAHAEFCGLGQGLTVVRLGGLGLGELTTCGYLSEEMAYLRLPPPGFLGRCALEFIRGEVPCLVEQTGPKPT